VINFLKFIPVCIFNLKARARVLRVASGGGQERDIDGEVARTKAWESTVCHLQVEV